MSCSKAKRSSSGPAIEVYNGPGFQTLRKAQRSGIRLDVYIVSARYGLIESSREIVPYDQRLSTDPGREYVESLRKAMTERIPWAQYETVFSFLGPDYELAVGDVRSRLRPRTQFVRASGQIGLRLQALKSWLAELPDGETE